MEIIDDSVQNLLRRYPALQEIHDSDHPLSQREISDRCGVSKSTAHRMTRSLVERDILRKENGGYVLTEYGKVLTDQTEEYISKVKTATEEKENIDFVTDTGLTVEHVADAKITRSSEERPFAPITRLAEATKEGDEVRILTGSVARSSFEIDRERVHHGEQDIEIVVSGNFVDSVFRGRERDENGRRQEKIEAEIVGLLDDALAEDLPWDSLRIFVYEKDVPYRMSLIDDVLYLGVTDERGIPTSLLETDDKSAVKWARRTYETYREEARYIES